VIRAIKFVAAVQSGDRKIADTGANSRGTDIGLVIRVASLFTVALVLQ